MELTVKRQPSADGATLGELLIDGEHECWTLEDVVRPDGAKVDGQTAIPAGRYRVIIDQSARFGCPMPHVLDVPGFEGIRIHAGNTAADTEGCLLLGQTHGDNQVWQSRLAFVAFFAKLQAALQDGGECWITYTDA